MARFFFQSKPQLKQWLALVVFSFVGIFIWGCRPASSHPTAEQANEDDGDGLFPITLQTDWFAQPEYAGFYQALATGLYERYGLEVTLLEGGPNADPMKRLILRRCDFINARFDDVMVAYARGMPVRFVGVTLQRNPLAILSHEAHAITNFEQLDGKRVMVNVAAPWIDYIEARYDIEMVRMPHNFGLNHYLKDKQFVMQCFLTNEPYRVRKLGANPHVLPIWEAEWDTYRGIAVHPDFLNANPRVVEAFVEATQEAWRHYLYEDPAPAHRLIQERNPDMDDDFMNAIRDQIIEYGLVDGGTGNPSHIGRVEPHKFNRQIEIFHDMGLIEKRFDYLEVFPKLRSGIDSQ